MIRVAPMPTTRGVSTRRRTRWAAAASAHRVLCVATSMANALKFHAVVAGKTLRLPDLSAFEGKRVEVIVVEDEGSERPMPARTRRFGTMAGEIEVASDFDAPLPEDIQVEFDGGVEH